MSTDHIVSRHFLRRRARARAAVLNDAAFPRSPYSVTKARRGPYRWYVVAH